MKKNVISIAVMLALIITITSCASSRSKYGCPSIAYHPVKSVKG